MASLQTSSVLSSSSLKRVNVTNVPKLNLPLISFSIPNVPTRKLVQQLKASIRTIPLLDEKNVNITDEFYNLHKSNKANNIVQLHAILEVVSDRIEMHHNVGEQRENWNSLLLNSINMITLAATTMVGIATSIDDMTPLLGLKLSSTLLFSAATAMSLVTSKIQPSQLTEEQRNATRLFKQLKSQIQTMIAIGNPSEEDVNDAIEKVLALDKAYPLPLLGGAMLEKFPSKFEPAIWWPKLQKKVVKPRDEINLLSKKMEKKRNNNGWSEELEIEMGEIVEVVKRKDMEDYERLGNLALKFNKALAISGPLFSGVAAIGSTFVNHGSLWPAIVAVTAGSLATSINAVEHGGQVGMVFEMYRNCGGFFKLLQETIEETLEEKNYEKRENGDLFEMKVAIQLGRSVSQLRELTSKSAFSRKEGIEIDEFASKIF